jgi:hypothetical protein
VRGEAASGALSVLSDRLPPLQMGDDAAVLLSPHTIGLKGEPDGMKGDRGLGARG